MVLGFTEFYRVCTWFYWVLKGFIGFYWILPGFTGFYRVLLGFTGFYCFFLVLLDFAGFYWVLVGFVDGNWLARRANDGHEGRPWRTRSSATLMRMEAAGMQTCHRHPPPAVTRVSFSIHCQNKKNSVKPGKEPSKTQ